MDQKDTSVSDESKKTNTDAEPKDNTANETAKTETKESVETEVDEQPEVMSEDDIQSELTELTPEKKEVSEEQKEKSREGIKTSRDLAISEAYQQISLKIKDAETTEEREEQAQAAIAALPTNLQGSLKKLFKGEDYNETVEQKDPQDVANEAIRRSKEEDAAKKAFSEVVEENGINTKTTTSVEKRKQIVAEVDALMKKPNKSKLIKLVANQMFNKKAAEKKGAVAGKVEPSKIKKPEDNPFKKHGENL